MYYVFLTLLVNILRYIKIPKKAGERSPASTHIRLYVCLSYIAHVYTQKPGVGKTNKRHFSWIKSPDIFRPCCVLCSIAGAFCSFSLMSHLVTSSGISSLFSLSYLTPFFCILFVCVRPQCFAPLLLFLLSHFLYTRHFIIHHVAPPLFFTPALFILFSLFSLCFFSRVLFLHLTVHHRAAYFLLFNTAGAALYPLIIFFFSYLSSSLIRIPLSRLFPSFFVLSFIFASFTTRLRAFSITHIFFFLDQHPAAYYRDQHSFPYYRPPLFVFFVLSILASSLFVLSLFLLVTFFLLSVTSIYYFDTSVFDMSLFTINNTCILQYSVVTM